MVDDWFMFMYDQYDSDRLNIFPFVHSVGSDSDGTLNIYVSP